MRTIATELMNERDYYEVMAEIEKLIAKGKGTIRNQDLAIYSNLAKIAQAYEQHHFIPAK